jgi:hypothetical protein
LNNALFKNQGKNYWIIVLMWLLAEAFYAWKFGFNFQLEATKYINEANFILTNHHFSQARYLFYSSTIFIIALSSLLKTGVYGALIFIMLINIFSYLYFYRALQYHFGNKNIALMVCLLLITFWPYQLWSIYLYTENIFYSSVLLLFSWLLFFKKINIRFLVITFLILALVIISRPLGILFVIPVLLFIFLHLNKKQKILFYIVSILSLIFLNLIIQTVFTTTSDWSMRRSILDQSLICDIPDTNGNKNIVLSDNPSQLYQLFFYITHNFPIAFKLALVRLRYFFFMVRDYYSIIHNAYLLVYLISIYLLIIFRFKKIYDALSKPLGTFIISVILLFALTISLQCDDYHNRFFLTLMPIFMTLPVVALFYKRQINNS